MEPIIEKKKKEYWNDFQTVTLIDALNEVNINKLLDSKRFRKMEIYNMVKREMEKQGVVKTVSQVQLKFKSLKLAFYATKNALQVSGADADVELQNPYYQQLIPIFGTTPKSNYSSIDSSGKSDKVVKKENPTPLTEARSEKKNSTVKASSFVAQNTTEEDEDSENQIPTVGINSKKLISVKTQRTRAVGQQVMLEKLTSRIQGKQEDLFIKIQKEQQQSDESMMKFMAQMMTHQTQLMIQGLRELKNSPNVNSTQPWTPESLSPSPPRAYTMPPPMTKDVETPDEHTPLSTHSLKLENLHTPTPAVPQSSSAPNHTDGDDKKRKFSDRDIINKKIKSPHNSAEFNSSLCDDDLTNEESTLQELLLTAKSTISDAVERPRDNQTEGIRKSDSKIAEGIRQATSVSAPARKLLNTPCSSTSVGVINSSDELPKLGMTAAVPIRHIYNKVSYGDNRYTPIRIQDEFAVDMGISRGDELQNSLIEQQENGSHAMCDAVYEVVDVLDASNEEFFDLSDYLVLPTPNMK